jgi:hypothetical protein
MLEMAAPSILRGNLAPKGVKMAVDAHEAVEKYEASSLPLALRNPRCDLADGFDFSQQLNNQPSCATNYSIKDSAFREVDGASRDEGKGADDQIKMKS